MHFQYLDSDFGVPCFTDDDECVSDPCLNGGFCLDDINDYFCVCAPGWNGKDCENGESSVALETLSFINLSYRLFEKYGQVIVTYLFPFYAFKFN